MANVTTPTESTLPVAGGDIIAAPLSGWITNLKNFVEGANIDENNVDYTSFDGIVVKAQTQTLSGAKTFSSAITASAGLITGGVIISDTDSTDDLGSTSKRFANLYVDSIGDTGQDLTIAATTTNLPSGHITDYNSADVTITHAANTLTIAGGNTVVDSLTSGGNIVSDTDSTDDLGTTGVRWANLFVDDVTVTNNVTIGGTLTLTGGITLNGNTTIGDSSADTLTVNSTITSNLIFTDATYDIGASGATRPRDLHLSRNALMGGTLGVTGLITATGGVSGALTGNVTGDLSGNVTGGTISGTTATFSDDLTVGTTDLIVDVSANKVGIGAAPTEELDIQGSGATQTIRLIRTDASTAGGITINSANGSNYVYNTAAKDLVISADNGATQTKLHSNGDFSVNTSQLFVDQSTSAVGVGTSSPAGLGVRSLNVKAPASSGADLTIEADNGNNFGVFFSGATASDPFSIFSNTGFKFATASDKNATGFDEHMRITSTGVGINCTPKDTLHVKVGTNLNWQFGYPNNSVTTLAALNDAESAYVTARIDAGTLELNGQSGGDVNLGAGVLVVDTSADRVGIGTSSPTNAKAVITTAGSSGNETALALNHGDATLAAGQQVALNFGQGGDANVALAQIAGEYDGSSFNGNLVFKTNTGASGNLTERARIDASGNMGLGVTPSAWSGRRALEIEGASTGYVTSPNGPIAIGSNIYYNGGDKFVGNGYAPLYALSSGNHIWYTSNNNTSGAGAAVTLTQAMTLTSAGLLGIGTSSPSTLLQLNETYGTAALSISDDSSAGDYLTFQIVGGQYNGGANEIQAINTTDLSLNVATARSLIFKTNNTERARIDSSGNFGIGTSSPQLSVSTEVPLSGFDGFGVQYSNETKGELTVNPINGEVRMGATNSTGTYFTTLYANGSEAARFTSDGDLLIGETTNQIARVYSKTSTSGDYAYMGVTTHADRGPVFFHNTNASFNDIACNVTATRAATTAYDLARWNSGAGADVEFKFTGDGTAYADGSWNGSGADYQEYFESQSGNAAEVGRAIVLDGDKVRYYNADTDSTDDIMGVTRPQADNKNSAVVGNVAWNHWTDKYLTDDWGVYLREDVTVWTYTNDEGSEFAVYERDELAKDPNWTPPEGATSSVESVRKLNPDYDQSLNDTYKSREERDEWWLIGLLGQIQVKAGEPINPRWIKMKNISDAVELYYVR